MHRAFRLSIFVLALSLIGGCEASRFNSARHADTASAYRRFLASYQKGERSEAARSRLEELQYLEARRVDRPLGYRQYLQEFPHGRFVSASRSRLAQLALARARDAAGLLLVLERHPGTSEAAQVERRLPGLLAREALASSAAELAQRFLDRYPQADDAPRVRTHLARLRYAHIPEDVLALEGFVETFAGTPSAASALQRLERLLADEVAASGDPELLQQFRLRFPGSSRLAELQRGSGQQQLRRSLAGLDLDKLGKLAAAPGTDPVAVQVTKWCRSRMTRCKALAELARQAGTWRPAQTLEALRGQVYDADPSVAWRATASLALLEESEAGSLLLELVGAERLATVWLAERALLAWFARRGTERRVFANAVLRGPYREVNEEERQRRGMLMLLIGKGAEAERLLGPLLERPSRQLVVGYLLLRQARRQALPAGTLLGRFLSGARARVDWLQQAFPAQIQSDTAAAAQLCEYELFALTRSLAAVQGSAPSSELLAMQRAAEEVLARWRSQLTKARPGYRVAEEPVPDSTEQAHQKGREAAMQKLRADPSPVAKLVLGALCELAGEPSQASSVCRSPRGPHHR